jgi:outer membrane protein assembly factor BamB
VFEVATGVQRWNHTLTGDISPNIALITDGALILRDSRLRALDLSDGTQRWADPDSALHYAPVPGLIFTQALDVHAVDSSTGDTVWATRWPQGVLFSDAISASEDAVYVHGSSTGTIGAFDLASGVLLWNIEHEGGLQPGVPMTIHDGLLIAVETDRQLVAFR